MTLPTVTRLPEIGAVYVSLRAAREYAATPSDAGAQLGEEEARRALTERLLDARASPGQDRPPYTSWRIRGRHELSAMVSTEGPLAVVITVSARRRP